MSRVHYAAIIGTEVVGVEATADAAAERALEVAPELPISVQELPDEPEQNPPASDMPARAWDACTLPQIPESALNMRLSEAHARLYPFFEGLIKRGVATRQYERPLDMADAWIGQNYKTSKPSQDPGRPAMVMGLALVPAAHARLASQGEGPYARLFDPSDDPRRALTEAATRDLATERRRMLRRWANEVPREVGKKFTLCAGSSQDCRDSCLVFAGQNASERYNTYRKVAQTMALLNEPDAFARMLVEAIDRWLTSPIIRTSNVRPFFRMNVLSDVPWELVAPWLFSYFRGHSVGPNASKPLTFYDYTKVPARKTPKNYDITFSLSGTDANRQWALEEINERGRRIAVVFIGHKKRWHPVKIKGPEAQKQIPLPQTFMGLPVIDGDISDVRPYDPAPACVGLRWKVPSGKRAGASIDLATGAFVTPVYIVSAEEAARYAAQVGAGRGLSRWRGGEEPNPANEQWLICAVTPRYQPIDQPMSQPG